MKTIEVEARELGLSYGEYIAYRDTGYLEKYKQIKKRLDEEKEGMANIYHSNIIGSNRADETIESRHAKLH